MMHAFCKMFNTTGEHQNQGFSIKTEVIYSIYSILTIYINIDIYTLVVMIRGS